MSMESPGAFNQSGSYSAEQTRRAVFAAFARTSANSPGILAGGLLSSSDMQSSAPASGLSVNVSAGEAIIGGTEGGAQGGYYARNASTTNLAISTANPSNPRIDTVCCTIADSQYTEPTGVSGNAAVLQVVTGTATAGATLTNLNGKATLPGSSLLLGYVLVPAGAMNIVTADIANIATPVKVQGTLAQANNLSDLASRATAVQNLGIARGEVTFTFSASTTSGSQTVTHGLGAIPGAILLQSYTTSSFLASNISAATTTTFTANAFNTANVNQSGSYVFNWYAIL